MMIRLLVAGRPALLMNYILAVPAGPKKKARPKQHSGGRICIWLRKTRQMIPLEESGLADLVKGKAPLAQGLPQL